MYSSNSLFVKTCHLNFKTYTFKQLWTFIHNCINCMWNGNKKYLILLYGVEQKSLTIIRLRSFCVLLKNIYYFYFRHEGIGLERCLEIRISLRLLFTQGLNSHIRIVIKFNVLSKICSSHKKYSWNELLLI